MRESAGPSSGDFQVLTGAGPAAIAVIRARGEGVERFARAHLRLAGKGKTQVWSRGRVLRAELRDGEGAAIDDILISVHAEQPLWDLRLHLHGSPWIVGRCTELLRENGLTQRHEERTTLWKTADSIEAEAHARLPRMTTMQGARWLCGQIDALRVALCSLMAEPVFEKARAGACDLTRGAPTFDWYARPLRVALVGPPNVGKSTLANALAAEMVSLVAARPGTTRDWIEVPGEVGGFPVVWLDTAGLHDGNDPLEAAGIAQTRRVMEEADALVVVLDGSGESQEVQTAFLRDYSGIAPVCVLLNKSDLGGNASLLIEMLPAPWPSPPVMISAAKRFGLEEFERQLLSGIGRDKHSLEAPCSFTARQTEHLRAAAEATDLERFRARLSHCLQEPEPD